MNLSRRFAAAAVATACCRPTSSIDPLWDTMRCDERTAMNRTIRTSLAFALACSGLAGCASVDRLFEPAVRNAPGFVPGADAIAVYENSPPGSRQYRFVKRLWVESWKSVFDVPHYSSVDAGLADLRNQAAALGGDAIVNFGCYNLPAVSPPTWNSLWTRMRTVPRESVPRQAGDASSPPVLICNGTVVKYTT